MRLTWGCHKLDVVSGTSPAGCPVGESKTRGYQYTWPTRQQWWYVLLTFHGCGTAAVGAAVAGLLAVLVGRGGAVGDVEVDKGASHKRLQQ